ncbi:MAG: hypothetical protein GY861_12640 [bacterium]|nr:hypothetical protein [bacterium]
MNTRKYWIKQGVDVDILKNFCHVFNHKPQQVKVAARLNKQIPIDNIVPGVNRGLFDMYVEVMDIYVKKGRNYDYRKTALWDKEWETAPKNNKAQVRKRFKEFFKLFDSIKKNGHKFYPNKQVRLLDIEGKARTREVRGNRFSEKYYRINGMKRCFISKFLGIKIIPCRVLKIRIVQL